jgi:GT2 family glycosyltransferase
MTHLFCREKASVITRLGLLFSNRENLNKACYAESGRGCLMSFTRHALSYVGGFDSNYQGNALREESDLFKRLKDGGYIVYFDPSIVVDHIMANAGGCRAEQSSAYWQTFFNNQVYFYRKNFGFNNWYIRCLLYMNIKQIKKQGLDVDVLFSNAYNRSKDLLGK